MVILSCFAKKNQNLNARKKVQFIPEKGGSWAINWTFFPCIQILIFLCEANQNDHIRLLYKFERDKKNWVVLGVVDMGQLLLKNILAKIYALD